MSKCEKCFSLDGTCHFDIECQGKREVISLCIRAGQQRNDLQYQGVRNNLKALTNFCCKVLSENPNPTTVKGNDGEKSRLIYIVSSAGANGGVKIEQEL